MLSPWMFACAGLLAGSLWNPMAQDRLYQNPVLPADYSDPDVIRVGDEFFLVSSSFHCVPGIPVLHSDDLVHWKIVGHALDRLPSPAFDIPRHGDGVWAPSIRYHGGEFWIFYGDPDRGIFMVKSKSPEGPWEDPVLVQSARGWIDPCPLWDDDGSAYLIHAWAKSRAGFNSILTVRRMSADGRTLLDTGRTVFDGHGDQPTIEGPKFYKRNGYYYIFAPAGGVTAGWQTALRSKHVFGPYEIVRILHQGSTSINGPHQGAWVETREGTSWFLHFQDAGPYGRVVHLQPMIWKNDWPVIGVDADGDGVGEPVSSWTVPVAAESGPALLPGGDEFRDTTLSLSWQWNANPKEEWYSLTARPGTLRLYPVPLADAGAPLWSAPNLLMQKFPAREFAVSTLIDAAPASPGDEAGVVVMGLDYACLTISRASDAFQVRMSVCRDADRGTPEIVEASGMLPAGTVTLRVSVGEGGVCEFAYSRDGRAFSPLGPPFTARKGKWVGARVGVFAAARPPATAGGYVDVEWIRISTQE